MAAVHPNDRILVIDRKLFRDDQTRLFVGVVEDYEDGIVRARGFTFCVHPYEVDGTERHGEERVRAVPLAGGDIIYILGRELNIAEVQLRRSAKTLILNDGRTPLIDLSEWLTRS